ncbi:MAG: hypothetical protein AB8G26_03930 [Ilumatobacter sp.]
MSTRTFSLLGRPLGRRFVNVEAMESGRELTALLDRDVVTAFAS